MSYYWRPVCVSCGEVGPDIRSGHTVLKFGPASDSATGPFKEFLDAHEYHDVRLLGEGRPLPWEND